MIEGPAAAIAARNRDDDDLEKIRTQPQRRHLGASSEADALAKFRNFHLFLLEATKNHLLVVAAVPIFTVLQSTVVRRRPTKEVIAEIELRPPEDLHGGRGPRRGRGAPPHGRAPRLPARQLPARHQLDRGLRPAQEEAEALEPKSRDGAMASSTLDDVAVLLLDVEEVRLVRRLRAIAHALARARSAGSRAGRRRPRTPARSPRWSRP